MQLDCAVVRSAFSETQHGNGLTIHRSRVRVLAGHLCVVALGNGQATYTGIPLSPSSIIWYRPRAVISFAGKVTAGLVESNGSRVYDYCHLWADCQEAGISSEPNARNGV